MFKKSLTIVALGSAVGAPYVASEWPKIKANVFGDSAVSAASYGARPPSTGAHATSSFAGHSPSHIIPKYPLAVDPETMETPLVDMNEAFRFNITPQWIISRWPRVTSGLPEPKLHGMRVALITGLLPDDLAGALTYYFTPTQQVARLTFSGTTGDPRRFVAFVKERFGFQPFNAQPGAEKYEIRWNGTAYSELFIRPASVVKSSMPNARYEVQMSIVDLSVE
ncbi:MAG: hypothetical protein IT427_02515 [Pirellulales bacterium]|nr:hypothetical protein [Pirellulales bacterium]